MDSVCSNCGKCAGQNWNITHFDCCAECDNYTCSSCINTGAVKCAGVDTCPYFACGKCRAGIKTGTYRCFAHKEDVGIISKH